MSSVDSFGNPIKMGRNKGTARHVSHLFRTWILKIAIGH